MTAEIATRVAPLLRQAEHLDSVPGINERGAQVVLAELGADLSRFPTAGHLTSWAGLCPGNHESAGKRQSGRTRKGNGWLRQLLMEAAHGAVRKKGTYLAAQYRHLIPRLGRKKALVAVAHSLLVIIYYVLTRDEPYKELGGDYFTERERDKLEARLVRRLEKLGHEVILKPKEQAA